jgi:asparagine synthase (glutamine-hydrolysing)
MCGINGFNWNNEKLIKKMNDKIEHRGPDDSGVYSDKGISIGNRRLSIIDLSKKGHQPMCNENNDLWIVYNGEIYNFKGIRDELEKNGHKFNSNTDTEVVLHAYEEYGFECLNKFNGMWAFCIYDSNKKILFLARDRIGIKPLYYYWDGKRFIFSSEIKAILEHDIERDINKKQLYHYLSFICTTRDETLFKKIYKVPSGNFLVFNLKNNKILKKEYWNVNNIKIDYSISEEEAIKELKELITKSIVMRRMADVPQGIFLSGGIDSSCLVAINSEFSERPINTFSIYFEDAGEKFDESFYARKVAEMFGTNHKEISLNQEMLLKFFPNLIYYQDEPISDPVCVPIAFLSKEVKRSKVKMIHVGEGGDELFVGYKSYLDLLKVNKLFYLFSKFPKPIKNNFVTCIQKNFFDKYFIFLKDNLDLI